MEYGHKSLNASPGEILENITNSVVVTDLDGRITYWNHGATEIFGYTAEEMLGSISERLYPKETNDHIKIDFEKLRSGGEYNGLWKGMRKDGNDVWIDVKVKSLTDRDGSVKGFIGVSTDVTQKVQAEKEKVKLENQYEHLLNLAPVGLVVHHHGEILLANNRFKTMMGIDETENMEGREMGSLIESEVNRQKFKQRMKGILEGKNISKEIYKLMRDGEKRWYEARTSHIRFAGQNVLLSIMLDVTTILHQREEIKYATASLKDFSNALPGVLFRIQEKKDSYALTLFSNKIERILGIPKQIIDQDFDQTIHNAIEQGIFGREYGKYFIRKIENAIQRNEVINEELVYNSNYGRKRCAVVTAIPHYQKDQENPIYNGIVLDITDKKLAERKLRRSNEKLHELTAYLDDIREEEKRRISLEIHDHLGPQLSGVKLDLHWMMEKLQGASEGRHLKALQEKLSDTVEHLAESIRSVRSIAHDLHPAVLESFGLSVAIEELMETIAKKTGWKIQLDITIEDQIIPSEIANTLYRVTQESVHNIMKHANASQVWVELHEDGEHFLRIRDDGIGMKYDPLLISGKLGLLGMEERVKRLNGQLLINSEPGGGTEVIVKIPSNND